MDSRVYWEVQPLGERTCGIHALNCILQGPEVRLYDLQTIANECKTLERDFLIQAGLTDTECDEMVASDTKGNFDFTVLEKALKLRGYSCTRLSNENLTYALLDEKHAFLLNTNSHWVSIRNMNKKWLLFDSMKEKPSEVDLLEYLKENLGNKHTAFLVKDQQGKHLPVFNQDHSGLTANQKFAVL